MIKALQQMQCFIENEKPSRKWLVPVRVKFLSALSCASFSAIVRKTLHLLNHCKHSLAEFDFLLESISAWTSREANAKVFTHESLRLCSLGVVHQRWLCDSWVK